MLVKTGALLSDATSADPLFTSAHAALVFALNFSMQQYDRPLMNRAMSAKAFGVSEGKCLSGTDGAGQAGMIRAELSKLPPLYQAVLIVSVAQPQLPCECRVNCCSGWKVNPEWQDALSQLGVAAAAGALSGCLSNGRLRSALIQRHFGAKSSLIELAEKFDVSQRTAADHSSKIKRWLFGSPATARDEAKPGVHGAAYRAFNDQLIVAGLVVN